MFATHHIPNEEETESGGGSPVAAPIESTEPQAQVHQRSQQDLKEVALNGIVPYCLQTNTIASAVLIQTLQQPMNDMLPVSGFFPCDVPSKAAH